ncbi:MAG TPA: hypothetical protein VHH11_03855 [Gammaproteobacteria bacterium]|jgi:hypothetical protein|nr:hypothetical protein [Gammaproteobacteria bacterium]
MKLPGIVSGALLAGLCAVVTTINAQVPPDTAASTEPTATLTAEEQQELHDLASEASDRVHKLAGTSPDQRIHSLVDEVLTGEQLAQQDQAAFVAMFEPDRAMLHRQADDGRRILERVMTGGVSGGPVPAKIAQLAPPHASIAEGSQRSFASARWLGYPRPEARRAGLPLGGMFLRTQATSGTVSEGGLTVSWTDSDDIVTSQASADAGDGVTVRMSGETWKDTSRWVADNETDVGLGISKARQGAETLGESAPSGSADMSVQDHARVQRCPSSDGVVTGKGKFTFALAAGAARSGDSAQGSMELREEFNAEGHVQENAIVRDVKVEVDFFFAKRSFQRDPNGRVVSDSRNIRLGGTVTFDPHSSDDAPEMTITRINTTGGLANAYALALYAPTFHIAAVLDAVRKAYLKAEKEWNFEDRENNSKCVTVTFAPKSRTRPAKPDQTVAVQAELLAINGQRATAGTFDELEPVKGGDIQHSGASTAGSAPAALSYTAPRQAWSPSDPPGFDVVKAKSRAGVFMRAHATEDEYRWLVKPGLKLTIHDRWENRTPLGSLLSEATFPIELRMAADGSLAGQATVARTHHQVENALVTTCTDTGHWTETWKASAAYDESGDNLTIRLGYRSSDKEGLAVCPPAPPKSYRDPGVSSDDVSTPLQNFTMPAEEGATKQFVFTFGTFSKTTIDVTVAPADADAH